MKNNAFPSLDTRLNVFSSTKKKVIYIKNVYDDSSFRYRALNMVEAIKLSNTYTATFIFEDEIRYIYRFLNNISIIIFQRTTWSPCIDSLIFAAKQHNIKIGYDIDDMIYLPEHVKSYFIHSNIDDALLTLHFGLSASYYQVMKLADFFITTTTILSEQLHKTFKKKTYVIRNFLSNDQIAVSKDITKTNHKKFIIGYFSGSPSHNGDFEIIVDDIERLLAKHKDMQLLIVGYLYLPNCLKRFTKNKQIVFQNFVPYSNLQNLIASVDVNIAPLENYEFNHAKSELKYFEAALVRTPSCVSPTEAYKKTIEHGVNGFLCLDGKWFETIENLYLNPKIKDKVAQRAYDDVVAKYTPKSLTKLIENTYSSILRKK